MLTGKTVLVAGAAGLLGSTLCQVLVQRGAVVIAADLDLDKLRQRLAAIGRTEQQIVLHQVDFNQPEQVALLFATYPQLTGAVNCTYPRHPSYGRHFFDVTLESFNENVQLHLGAAFLFAQQAAKHFSVHQQPLSLVNLSSVYGVIAPKFEVYKDTPMTMPVEYAAIKSAIVQLTRYVTSYVNDSRFRVNAISPGGLLDGQPETFLQQYKQHTLGKGMLNPTDICGAVVFLLSDDSAFMQGQNLIIDDGFTL